MVWIIGIFLIFLVSLLLYLVAGGPKLSPETDAMIDRVLNSELPEFIRGRTGLATSDGLNIWYESISPEGASKGTVLLLMGQGGNALMWPPAFIRVFVEAGYQLIRYDHRGTGLSDWVKAWDRKQPYSLVDMSEDAVAVLDALELQTAHLVGLSMGGMIAQELAARHPDRVSSLTLLSTSGYIGDPELPGPSSSAFWRNVWKGLPLIKYRLLGGEKNLIKEPLAKMVAMGYEALDFKEIAEMVLYDLRKRKGINLKAMFQHYTAITPSGSRYERLQKLNTPTLVIHGTADWLNPIEHGQKLANVIPNAKGLWLEGVDHVFPYPNMAGISQKIIEHFENVATEKD